MIILFIFLLLFFLLTITVPMFIALAAVPFITFDLFTKIPLSILPQRMFAGVDSFPLMAIPFFILAANIMARGGISEKLIGFVNSLVGHIYGGLGICAVLACALFGAITGSSASTVVAIGGLMYPALRKAGYDDKFSLGVVTCSALLGMIIPPSNAMVVYGAITGVSVGALFISGFGAGLVFVVIYSTYCYFYAKKKMIPVLPRVTLRGILKATREALWALGMPVIIIGGIYSGVFTPTESAAISVVYSTFVCLVIYRKINLKHYWDVCLQSAMATARVLILVSAASLFSWLLTVQGVTSKIVTPLATSNLPSWMVLAISNIAILIAGMFVDVFSNLLILVPILINPVIASGISGLHFGIVASVNSDIGNITPPFGLNLFVATGAFGKSYVDVVKAVLPWVFLSLISLIIVTYVPEISLWLPRRMYPGIK
jgi:C4-dicarboxylate transporter, DctM subunit